MTVSIHLKQCSQPEEVLRQVIAALRDTQTYESLHIARPCTGIGAFRTVIVGVHRQSKQPRQLIKIWGECKEDTMIMAQRILTAAQKLNDYYRMLATHIVYTTPASVS